jgi:hypothetical protein
MPMIFAIDGAPQDVEYIELGAYSSSVAALQSALVTLGGKVGDATLKALVIDGLIGPKTTAATNLAFTRYISPGQAPDNFRTGALSQSSVAGSAATLAQLVESENQRRSASTGTVLTTVTKAAAPGSTAVAPYVPQGPPLPANLPASSINPNMVDTQATFIKWSAIGLGVVSLAGLVYLFLKRRGTLGDCGFGETLGSSYTQLLAQIEDTKDDLRECQRQLKAVQPGSSAARNLASRCRKLSIGLDWLRDQERGSRRWQKDLSGWEISSDGLGDPPKVHLRALRKAIQHYKHDAEAALRAAQAGRCTPAQEMYEEAHRMRGQVEAHMDSLGSKRRLTMKMVDLAAPARTMVAVRKALENHCGREKA